MRSCMDARVPAFGSVQPSLLEYLKYELALNSQSPLCETRLSMPVILPLSTLRRVPITYCCAPCVTITSENVLQRSLSRKLRENAIGRAVFHIPLSAATSFMFSRYFTLSPNVIFARSPAFCAARELSTPHCGAS